MLTNTPKSGIMDLGGGKMDKETLGIMPNAITASTTQNKIQGYLLNNNHPHGKNKASLINSVLGYHYQNWDILSDKIYAAVQNAQVTRIERTKFGVKYQIPVYITGETGKGMTLKTVWQTDYNSNIPRLITITFDNKEKRGK